VPHAYVLALMLPTSTSEEWVAAFRRRSRAGSRGVRRASDRR
jgi:hypothetical protein